MDYYIKMLRFYSIASNQEIGNTTFDYQVLQEMENSELMKQTAPKVGIQIIPEQITETINGYLLASIGENTTQGNTTPSDVDLDKIYQQWLGQIRLSDSEYRQIVESIILTGNMTEYFKEQKAPTEARQVHLYAIKLDTKEKASEVVQRLQEGDDFATVAKEYSIDEESKQYGGEMGWVPRGVMLPELDEAAFSLEAGNVSQPIETSTGYYVIKVSEIDENKTVDNEYRDIIAANEMAKWLKEQRDTNIDSYLDDAKITWAIDHSK